jgi:hypothetical protein
MEQITCLRQTECEWVITRHRLVVEGPVNVDVKSSILYKVAKFLNTQLTVSFSTRTLVHSNSYFTLLNYEEQKLKKEQEMRST